jgi:hypothetical protein
VKAETFNQWYRDLEAGYREFAETFWTQDKELRRKCRQKRLEGADEREVKRYYIEEYTKLIEAQDHDFNNGAGGRYADAVAKAERTIYGPGGGMYAHHLVSLASAPDDKLSELGALAEQAGDADLRRAVAHTADRRGRHTLFQTWVDSQQDTHNAMRFLDTTPPKDQAVTRMLTAMRPPKAVAKDLEPTPEDKRKYAEQKRSADRPVREFFGGSSTGKRQTGRRTA